MTRVHRYASASHLRREVSRVWPTRPSTGQQQLIVCVLNLYVRLNVRLSELMDLMVKTPLRTQNFSKGAFRANLSSTNRWLYAKYSHPGASPRTRSPYMY